MGLLKSTNDVPGIDFYEYRESHYYNKYEYRMRITIPCIRYTWYCKSPEDLEKKIRGEKVGWSTIRKEDLDKVIEHAEALKSIITLQQSRKKSKDLGLRVEGTDVAFFSNDLQKLKDIQILMGSQYECDYTMVQTSQYSDVKEFVHEPKHKYRVYLRSRIIEEKTINELKDLFQRTPSLYPSSALKAWLGKNHGWYHRWASSSHFIDYNDESTLSYLSLIHGDLLGKKYKLEKRPEPV
jgi:hypothetical protein